MTQAPVNYSGPGPQINNWLWQAVVVTLCCCLPLGVVGIIFAAQVNGKVASGDIAGAQDAAAKAKMFTLIGLIGGLVINGGVTIFYIVVAVLANR